MGGRQVTFPETRRAVHTCKFPEKNLGEEALPQNLSLFPSGVVDAQVGTVFFQLQRWNLELCLDRTGFGGIGKYTQDRNNGTGFVVRV